MSTIADILTNEHIDSVIVDLQYHEITDKALVICILTLKNGHIILGEAVAKSPNLEDMIAARKIAYDSARNKIWAFERYAILSHIYDA